MRVYLLVDENQGLVLMSRKADLRWTYPFNPDCGVWEYRHCECTMLNNSASFLRHIGLPEDEYELTPDAVIELDMEVFPTAPMLGKEASIGLSDFGSTYYVARDEDGNVWFNACTNVIERMFGSRLIFGGSLLKFKLTGNYWLPV